MSTLRDVMDAVADADAEGTGPVRAELYGDLAPLYDFERERMRDHDAIADYVAANVPEGATSVAVGACGGGLLLSHLAERFDRVVGIDASRRILELAAERTDADLVAADLRSFVAPGEFDVFTLLGGSIAHLPARRGAAGADGCGADDDCSDDRGSGGAGGPGDAGRSGEDAVPSVLSRIHESLAPGGVFLCDFMESGVLESGSVAEDTFESDRFELRRTVITTGEGPGGSALGGSGRYTFAYEVTDRQAGETVRVGTSTPVREFSIPALLGATLNAGFDDVTLLSPPTHGRGLLARRAE